MDSLTQIVLGAAVGEVVQGKKLGNRAMIWGAIAGTIPDLDVFVGKLYKDPVDELAFHRGISHSFFFAFTFSMALSWLTYWIYDKGNYKKPSFAFSTLSIFIVSAIYVLVKSGGSNVGLFGVFMISIPALWYGIYRYLKYKNGEQFESISLGWKGWYALFFWAIITHPILDCFTVYGTQIFLPFSNYRVGFDNISVADPAYTVPFLACLIAASMLSRKSKYRSLLNKAGIAISSIYMIWTFYNKHQVNAVVESTLANEGISYSRYMTSPTILNNILWSTTVESDSVFYQGQYSFYDVEKKFDLVPVPKNRHLIADGDGDHTIETLRWFSNDYYGVMKRKDGRLQINDLRYGSFSGEAKDENDFIFRFVVEKNDSLGRYLMDGAEGGPPRGRENEVFSNLWSRIIGGKPKSSTYENGVVVTAHNLASQVGVNILKKGGNAFDAAIAVHFALAVVYPRAGNLGGGGFAVFFDKNGNYGALDFREKAPSSATKDMYLDSKNNVIKDLSLKGHYASGVPGSVKGMKELYDSMATLPLEVLLEPSINLANNGYAISENEASRLNKYKRDFEQYNFQKTPFTKDNLWLSGDTLKNINLGYTMKKLAEAGLDDFYFGSTASQIALHYKKHDGNIMLSDLKNYQAIWRQPITCSFDQYEIVSMPLPSSGGIALCQILDGVERLEIGKLKPNSFKYIHRLAEVEKRVFTIRNRLMGDPDFVNIDIDHLMSDPFLVGLYSNINDKATNAIIDTLLTEPIVKEAYETTHISIADGMGNAIALTTTLNGNYGSFVVVEETGILMNNEMDDFSLKPGVANQYGLLGSEHNAIEASKRMLSSMTPTIVLKDNKPFLLLGSPGGPTIITTVLQTLLNVTKHNMTLQEAVDAPRFHDQGYPRGILIEKDKLSQESIDSLMSIGHSIRETNYIGAMEAVLIHNNGTLKGAADSSRGKDDSVQGY